MLEGRYMTIAFERHVCCDLDQTIAREWLITNGQGAYAAGTVAGVLTRMSHGLLVAPVPNHMTPYLLLAKIDEEVVFDQRTYYLGTNEYQDGTLNPAGFGHLETFRLEEGFPVFTYHIGGIDGIILEKRIWMPTDYHTTCIQYRVLPRQLTGSSARTDYIGMSGTAYKTSGYYSGYSEAAQRELTLTLLPFSAYRLHTQPQYGHNDWSFQVQPLTFELLAARGITEASLPTGIAGCSIKAYDGALPYAIVAVGQPDSSTTFIPTNVWYWHFLRRHEQAAGRAAVDDLYLPGVIRAKLWPGEDATLTIVVTTEELSSQLLRPTQLDLSYQRSVAHQRNMLQPERYFGEGGETSVSLQVLPLPSPVIPGNSSIRSNISNEEFLRLLLQAAERFLIERKVAISSETLAVVTSPGSEKEELFPFARTERMPVVLSNYYGTNDCTRHTLIALPGLMAGSRHASEARRILYSLARYFHQGLLPDRMPHSGTSLTEQDYGSIDTTLWYLYALDAYIHLTHDYELMSELYPRLVKAIDCYIHGTTHGVQVDPDDGLLRTSLAEKALTWMDASPNGVPVTPRQGKPIEVNALWYLALSLLHEWSQQQQQYDRSEPVPAYYEELRKRCQESFQRRFWHADGGYLYDVVDGPNGNDASIRPNQLLALSLRYPVLNKEHWQAVLDNVTQHLVTPCGLRTLAPQDSAYRGQPSASEEEQLSALHQGSIWPWLLGPYIDALRNLQEAEPVPLHATPTADTPPVLSTAIPWWQTTHTLLATWRTRFSTSQGILAMPGGVYTGDGDTLQPLPYLLASVLTAGELLRIYHLLVQKEISQPVLRDGQETEIIQSRYQLQKR
jgi:glycogen debranching enzyme